MAHGFLADILILLVASIPAVVLLRRFRLPPLVGFLLVGVLLGPHALGWVREREAVEALAQIGIALLLFTVGLEFSIPRMLLLRRQLVLGGGGQLVLTIGAVAGIGLLAGQEWRSAMLLAFLAAQSGTALIMKVLSDSRQVEAPHGRFAVAVSLAQDLAVIPLLLLVPLLAEGAEGPSAAGGLAGLALVLGKAVLAVAAVLLFARYGFSRLASVVVSAGGRELFTLFIVAVAFGAAWITHALGLPLALGAFVAGLVISESEYSHQVVDEILPFRDVFSALFFASVGMLLDPTVLLREPGVVLASCLALLVVKGGIVFALARWLLAGTRPALLAAAALFNIGEFSFVLAKQAMDLGILGELEEQRFLAVAVLTMIATPFVMRGVSAASARVGGDEPRSSAADAAALPPVDVLVAGYGLNGQHLAQVLSATAIPHRVIEMSPGAIQLGRKRGVPMVQGDVSRVDTLRHVGLERAKVLVIAISDPDASRRAVVLARGLSAKVQVIVRTRFLADTEDLLRLGANQVVPEEFETSVEIFGRVLRELHVPRGTIAVQTELIRREGYQILRSPGSDVRAMEVVQEILASTAVDTLFVSPACRACGRTLAELELRQRTGATVISVVREGQDIHGPGAGFRLEPNDLLVVLGNHEQLDRARDLIAGQLPPEP